MDDLERVSGDMGTALIESFNHLASVYAPKDHYFDAGGHELRTKLAIMAHNSARYS